MGSRSGRLIIFLLACCLILFIFGDVMGKEFWLLDPQVRTC